MDPTTTQGLGSNQTLEATAAELGSMVGAFGTLATVNGVGDFMSSIVVGALWTAFGIQVAFAYSAALFLIGAIGELRLGSNARG